MDSLDRIILKLFVNEYYNIHEIAFKLNISEHEVQKVLDKYLNILTSFKIDALYVK